MLQSILRHYSKTFIELDESIILAGTVASTIVNLFLYNYEYSYIVTAVSPSGGGRPMTQSSKCIFQLLRHAARRRNLVGSDFWPTPSEVGRVSRDCCYPKLDILVIEVSEKKGAIYKLGNRRGVVDRPVQSIVRDDDIIVARILSLILTHCQLLICAGNCILHSIMYTSNTAFLVVILDAISFVIATPTLKPHKHLW